MPPFFFDYMQIFVCFQYVVITAPAITISQCNSVITCYMHMRACLCQCLKSNQRANAHIALTHKFPSSSVIEEHGSFTCSDKSAHARLHKHSPSTYILTIAAGSGAHKSAAKPSMSANMTSCTAKQLASGAYGEIVPNISIVSGKHAH